MFLSKGVVLAMIDDKLETLVQDVLYDCPPYGSPRLGGAIDKKIDSKIGSTYIYNDLGERLKLLEDYLNVELSIQPASRKYVKRSK